MLNSSAEPRPHKYVYNARESTSFVFFYFVMVIGFVFLQSGEVLVYLYVFDCHNNLF